MTDYTVTIQICYGDQPPHRSVSLFTAAKNSREACHLALSNVYFHEGETICEIKCKIEESKLGNVVIGKWERRKE